MWIEQAAGRHGDAVYLAEARGAGTLTYAGLRADTLTVFERG